MVMLFTLDLSVILSTSNMYGEFTFATHIPHPKFAHFLLPSLNLKEARKVVLFPHQVLSFGKVTESREADYINQPRYKHISISWCADKFLDALASLRPILENK